MQNLFESKVSYEKIIENGTQKKVTESYLFDALSWTEAEARTVEELSPSISGEFSIVDIKRVKITEVFLNDRGDRFFKAKIQFITLDEKSGLEKKINAFMLAQANDIDEAQEIIKDRMKSSASDYVIAEVKETKIVEFFPYRAESENSED